MIRNGAVHHNRLLAFLLTAVMLLTTCFTPAIAADIWDSLILNLHWTDGQGNARMAAALPVKDSIDRAYWVNVDASALGQPLTLEALAADPAYSFYLADEMGNPTTAFTWYPEMDALSTGMEYAHQVFYAVDGIQADQPIWLFVSSSAMPQEEFQPYPVPVPVYYVTEDDTVLDTQYVECWAGEITPVWASSLNTEGYALTSADTVAVAVDQYGAADPREVTFVYRQVATPTPEPTDAPTPTPVAEVSVPVVYRHVNGEQLDFQELFLAPGTHEIWASSAKVAAYQPVGSQTVTITVYPDGSTDQSRIVFEYEDVKAAEAVIPVYYYHEDGTRLDMQELTLPEGTHRITPASARVEGLELSSASYVEVTVYADGSASAAYAAFTYKTPYAEPSKATITVHYQDDRGRDLAPVQTFSYSDGSYIIAALPEGLSANYELAPGISSEVVVTVSGGVPSQKDVYFFYQQKQVQSTVASVTVHYLDTLGNQIAEPHTVMLAAGRHELSASAADLPKGAELVSDAVITVEVYENGTYSPQEIAFYYRIVKDDDKQAEINVYYRDDRGNDVADAQRLYLGNGTHIVRANPANLPEGYAIFAGTDTEVEVTVRNGVPTQSQIVFYYRKTEITPTVFKLPVSYYDTEGNPIATTQHVEIGAGTWAIQAAPTDLPDGYTLAMDPVLTVIVRQDGTTDPEEIAFYYRAPEKTALVTVVYLDQSQQAIREPFTVELGTGYHTIQGEASRVPGGYDPDSAKPVQVYVSREGVAEPAQVFLTFKKAVLETPIPVGETVYRYANVNDNSVALRSEPSTARKDTVLKRISKNTKVFVLQESYNSKNEVWAMVNVGGQIGYMRSDFLDIMTQARSDEYAAGSTAVPTFTPVPTPTEAPTEVPTPTPTQAPTDVPVQAPSDEPPEITQAPVEWISPPPAETPTLEPLPVETPTEAPTATPTASPSPTPYTGYALTTRAIPLRSGISTSDMTIQHYLEANELVQVVSQVPDPVTGEMWSIVSTLDRQAGFVQDASLRPITDKEAEPYIDLWVEQNKTPEPTEIATPSPEPMQMEGYGVVLGDAVPFRQMASEVSRIIDNLDAGTIVYITGQTPGDNQYWHSVNYNGYWGYIRTDLVRMLTIAEEEAYIESLNTPAPTEEVTNPPFDENGLSSYGYVDCSVNSSVNWREAPSTGAKKVGELKRYAMCLVRSTVDVGGVTWYEVSYNDKIGYLHGDFFKQMTITELNDFLGSDQYLQGVSNNAPSTGSNADDEIFNGSGGLVSPEDEWVSQNPGAYASYEPFNPIGTVRPIQTTPTLEPLPGVTPVPTATPTATPTFNPLPDVTYPVNDEGDGGSAIVWFVVASLLLLTAGGVFALVRHQQNRRRIAMRAAQRRAQAARAQQQQQRPYARTAAPGQPRTGTYPNQQPSVRRPAAAQPVNADDAAQQSTSQYAPYTGSCSYSPSGYYRPAESKPVESEFTPEEEATQPVPRVGRRTAYRQTQEQHPDDQDRSYDQ